MDLTSFELFAEVVRASAPYAIVWTIGSWVVHTIINWVTGRGYDLQAFYRHYVRRCDSRRAYAYSGSRF